jgi:hypothetical protein
MLIKEKCFTNGINGWGAVNNVGIGWNGKK